MAMPFARRDIEAAGAGASSDDSPAAKKGKPELAGARPALTRSEAFAFAAVLALFTAGIFCVFLTAPRGEFGQILRLPRSLADVRLLKYAYPCPLSLCSPDRPFIWIRLISYLRRVV
jgi:hypothetical protein